MKHLVSLVFVLLLFSRIAIPVHAKLLINEFSSATGTDWVEIYNDSDTEVPLSSYRLRDSTSSNKLDLNGILSGKGLIVFEWGDRLNNAGDIIRIVKADDESVEEDKIAYGSAEGKVVEAPVANQYAARTADGGSTWGIFTQATRGLANANMTPVPTVTPSPTETPKPTPTPTKNPTPTKPQGATTSPTPPPHTVQTITPRVLAAQTLRSTPTPSPRDVPTAVLVRATETEWPTIQPSKPPVHVQTLGVSALNPAVLLIVVGALFLLSCLGYAVYLYRRGQL